MEATKIAPNQRNGYLKEPQFTRITPEIVGRVDPDKPRVSININTGMITFSKDCALILGLNPEDRIGIIEGIANGRTEVYIYKAAKDDFDAFQVRQKTGDTHYANPVVQSTHLARRIAANYGMNENCFFPVAMQPTEWQGTKLYCLLKPMPSVRAGNKKEGGQNG